MGLRIIGAGLAGLLAANMLYKHKPKVIERQSVLPNNHSAVLRFRSSVVGDVLNIPFKKVQMIKSVVAWRNPVADALSYARKNGGVYRSDRSVVTGLVVADRWIAPLNLIERMAEDCSIDFGTITSMSAFPEPTISTIPMPDLMKLLSYDHSLAFSYTPGVNLRARIEKCEAYVSLLVPNPLIPFSRVSITGDELIIESTQADLGVEQPLRVACDMLGLRNASLHDIELVPQAYAKIEPISEEERKAFMFWATDTHNVYSLGRYATWRPGLLLDDLVKDVRLIEKWLTRSDRYEMARDRKF